MATDLLAGRSETQPVAALTRPPRIAVVDSGLGGLTVFAAVAAGLPQAELTYLADDAAFPYGRLGDAALVARVAALVDRLIAETAPDLVVIACNTASTLVLPHLRAAHAIPFVGTVPAVKPAAALSATKRISVLATPGTVARDYTRALIATHAAGCAVTLVGSPRLAGHAEAEMRGEPVPDAAIAAEIAPAFVDDGRGRTDVVVLACTHFPLLGERLRALAPWPVQFVDPAPAVARRAAALIGPLAPTRDPRPPRALFTGDAAVPPALAAALARRGLPEIAALKLPFAG
ncbi:MAG TPA: glutamate racemase [Hyphomicrobiales bacterium]|nr:glutamate racemase [Hyphomicrobiales bacterium]